MHFWRIAFLATVFISVLATGAQAQTVGLGITRGGELNRIGVAVANVVSAHSDGVQMRTQPMAGTQQYIPIVNAGELEFGLGNAFQTYFAYTGTGMSKDRKHEDLRIVATLVPFEIGAFVATNSPIKTYADLKGKKMASGFASAPLMQLLGTGWLANGNLTWDDVQKVPLASLGPLWDMLKQGQVDVASGPVGSGQTRELEATMPGGIRFLSLDESPEAMARMHKIMPLTYVAKKTPEMKLPGVRSAANVLGFDILLWAHKNVPDEVVYKTVKAIHGAEAELAEVSPVWKKFKKENMAKDQSMPMHPGAVKFYKEAGVMPQ